MKYAVRRADLRFLQRATMIDIHCPGLAAAHRPVDHAEPSLCSGSDHFPGCIGAIRTVDVQRTRPSVGVEALLAQRSHLHIGAFGNHYDDDVHLADGVGLELVDGLGGVVVADDVSTTSALQ